jgi:NADH-quinone oxidoreductase subunit E
VSVRRLDPVQPSSPFSFTGDNLSWAKSTISKYPNGKQASAVIPLLWRAQEQNAGWVSRPVLEYIADMLGMAYIRVLEVATFYTMFQLSPVGTKAHVQVCGTTPCMLRGANDLIEVCKRKIHSEPHHRNGDGTLSWEEVECLGACVNAPMVQVWKDTYEDLTPETLEVLIDAWEAGEKTMPGPQNGRTNSMALGGASVLTDKAVYRGERRFTRQEAPPPPPPAAPAPATPPPKSEMPSPAAVKPAAADIRPISKAAKLTDAQMKTARSLEAAASGPGTLMTEKAQAEQGIVRATQGSVTKAATKTPATSMKRERIPDPPKPVLKSAPKAIDGRPELLKKAIGKADDLKLIHGVGPALEKLLNKIGVWHFDQIANWSAKELAWIDEKLEGFKGRAKRDDWIRQAKKLATEGAAGQKPGKK